MTTLLKPRRIARYGWRKDSLDQRDRSAKVVAPMKVTALPATVDLNPRRAMPPIVDQSTLGSCVGNATARIFEYALRLEKLADFAPSRLAIYYGARFLEGTVDSDAGCEIRDAMKFIAKQGAGPESLWPYNIALFRSAPNAAYLAAAKSHLCISYERVEQTELGLKRTMAAGFPIVYGISVFDSFESDAVARTGRVPMPKASESLLGGHAIVMTGYTKTRVRFANSWGTSWGAAGFGTMPLAYVLDENLASDFWICRAVE
jgi:C1A family cysteine protease